MSDFWPGLLLVVGILAAFAFLLGLLYLTMCAAEWVSDWRRERRRRKAYATMTPRERWYARGRYDDYPGDDWETT